MNINQKVKAMFESLEKAPMLIRGDYLGNVAKLTKSIQLEQDPKNLKRFIETMPMFTIADYFGAKEAKMLLNYAKERLGTGALNERGEPFFPEDQVQAMKKNVIDLASGIRPEVKKIVDDDIHISGRAAGRAMDYMDQTMFHKSILNQIRDAHLGEMSKSEFQYADLMMKLNNLYNRYSGD